MPDIANYLAQNSPRYNLARMDSEHAAADLDRNAAARIPQSNRAQDLAIQGAEQEVTETGRKNAAGLVSRYASAVAESASPMRTAQQVFQNPQFLSAAEALGFKRDMFRIDPTDNDETIKSSALNFARATGAQRQQTGQYKLVPGPNGSLLQVNLESGAVTPVLGREPAPSPGGEPLVSVVGPDGKPIFVPRSQAAGMTPFQRPTGGLSPRDSATAKQKLSQLAIARQQLALVREKFGAIKNSLSAGPGGQFVPTQAGQAFDTAVDSMRNVLTTITRVPGVGSMSDFETRLAQAQFPSRGKYEVNTEQQISSIEKLLTGLEQGYSGMLSDSGAQGGDLSSLFDEELMRIANGEQP